MNLLSSLLATAKGLANHPLHQHAKLKALGQFGVRQVAARLVGGEIAVPFPNGTRLLVPPRMKGAAHFIMPGLCEFEPMSFVAHFLRPGDLLLDVGANLGAYTLLASGVARARSLSIEPSPGTFHCLVQTVRLNGLENIVTAYQAALGAQPGTLRLTDGLGTENSICSHEPGTGGLPVQVTTLDELTRHAPPTLAKIDVEGYEAEVIAGGSRTLLEESLLGFVIERAGNASRYGFDEEQLHRQIRSLGFSPWAYAPFTRQLSPLPSHATGNLIYLRKPESARERLQAAPAFEFAGRKI